VREVVDVVIVVDVVDVEAQHSSLLIEKVGIKDITGQYRTKKLVSSFGPHSKSFDPLNVRLIQIATHIARDVSRDSLSNDWDYDRLIKIRLIRSKVCPFDR
jgi:hypothetical protein